MKKLFKAIGIALCLVGLTSCEKEIKPTEEESPLYADFNFDYNDLDYSSMSLSEELDSNIKEDSQNKMENLKDNYEFEWAFFTVMDAKTGAILGTSSSPSFDPNKKDISNYLDLIKGLEVNLSGDIKYLGLLMRFRELPSYP